MGSFRVYFVAPFAVLAMIVVYQILLRTGVISHRKSVQYEILSSELTCIPMSDENRRVQSAR